MVSYGCGVLMASRHGATSGGFRLRMHAWAIVNYAAAVAICVEGALPALAADTGVETPRAGLVRAVVATPIQRHIYDPILGGFSDAAPESGALDLLVYSNVPPLELVFPLPLGTLVADDISTIAPGGCPLSGYEVLFSGGGSGDGPGFEVRLALYNACPGEGGSVLAGTEAIMSLENDGLHSIFVDLSDAPVSIDGSVWVGVEGLAGSVGWLAGSPAQIGFTQDVYHFPTFPCQALFAGTTAYAGFHAKLYCSGEFDAEFVAYLNPELTGQVFQPGANHWIADDVTLVVDDCLLIGLKMGMISAGGPFTLEAAVWKECDPATAIEGTQVSFLGVGNGLPEVAVFDFPDGIPLPVGQREFWVAWRFDSNLAAVIVAGDPIIGLSEDLIGLWDFILPGACFETPLGGAPSSLALTVRCLGNQPVGACCKRELGETCHETVQIECIGAAEEWVGDVTCEDEPFDPPCGNFACCLPESGPMGSCENMAEVDCLAAGGDPNGAIFCDDALHECGWFGCRNATGDCCLSHDSVGCQRPDCCNLVCDIDVWCCTVDWDETCRDEARELCGFGCPAGGIEWVDPPHAVVDARQPHPPNDPGNLQGIDTILVQGPPSASRCCWSLCETAEGDTPNFIVGAEESSPGEYTLLLGRPITPGAVTFISYSDGATAAFASHPSNVNGDPESGSSDILALIDALNGIVVPLWGMYSCDVDHSGECNPADILRVLDLLNGAATFSVWNGTSRPMGSGPCGG